MRGAHARGRDGIAPVIPLFGGPRGVEAAEAGTTVPGTAGTAPPAGVEGARPRRRPVPSPHTWHTTWDDLDADADAEPVASRGAADVAGAAREAAHERALRRLRSRQLSTAEVRTLLREPGTDGRRLDDADVDDVLRAMTRQGYLDDARLAEQLVHIGVDRKGQGRRAVARTLAARGIPGDVAGDALRALRDDDDERALEFAHDKVRAMRRLDRDTAVRRLVGQLSRRGYPASVALSAARRAWDDTTGAHPVGGGPE